MITFVLVGVGAGELAADNAFRRSEPWRPGVEPQLSAHSSSASLSTEPGVPETYDPATGRRSPHPGRVK